MNENIDLTKILEDCPRDTTFYTTLWGEVAFEKISKCISYPIQVKTKGDIHSLTKNGKWFNLDDAECIIFPSKDQRDWSKFTAPWYKKERFDPYTLQPFDKVLVKDGPKDCWYCGFFSHVKRDPKAFYKYVTVDSSYEYCIPYNEGTKHLVGTKDEAPEYYRYWEDLSYYDTRR